MSESRYGGFGRFLGELRRRHVFRATMAYAAVAFVVLQGAEIVVPAFGLSEWVLRLVVVFAALGLPLAAVLAWVYEVTPGGIRTMASLDEEAGVRAEAGRSFLPRLALLVVTLVAVSGAGWWWVSSDVPSGGEADRSGRRSPAAERFVAPTADAAAVPIRSLVVLPFESFAAETGEGEDYFAAGMQEALISRLGQLGMVRVISRTTANSYRRRGKSVTQVGQELGVEGVVEGSVLRDGGRVRITVQLIHAPSDTHLWSEDYEREMTDIIGLQREVSEAVARAIEGELEADRAGEVLAAGPAGGTSRSAATADHEAAVADLRGRAALADESPGGVSVAERHFRHALEEDSTYAPARVGLVSASLLKSLGDAGIAPEALHTAERELEEVLRVEPGSPEALEMLQLLRGVDAGDSTPGPARPGLPHHGFLAPTTEMASRIQARLARLEAGSEGTAGRLRGARSLLGLGRLDEAADLLEATVTAEPRQVEAWDELERIRVMQGDPAAAVAVRRRREAAAPAVPGAPGVDALARAVARDGARGYWRWRLDDLRARQAAGEDVSPVEWGAAWAGTGDRARALQALGDAAEATDPRLVIVRVDPVWDPYRQDGRFLEVVRSALSPRGRSDRTPR